MKKRYKILIVFLGIFLGLTLIFSTLLGLLIHQSTKPPLQEPKVLAFYYPWYDEKSWQNIPHTPSLGISNSKDPKVITQHLKWAEAAEIDAFIVSWWGKDHFTDRNFKILLQEAEKLHNQVKLCIYYERVPCGPENRIIEELEYILQNYGESSAFFKIDGKPVIFIYGRAMNEARPHWKTIIPKIREKYEAVFITDLVSFATFDPSQLSQFDGFHTYNILSILHGLPSWAIRWSLQFQVGIERHFNKISMITVYPGYDDTQITERNYPKKIDRENGKLYEKLWQYAIEANPDWILITSFNEWYEGTEVEPSKEYGDLYLRLTAKYAAEFKRR